MPAMTQAVRPPLHWQFELCPDSRPYPNEGAVFGALGLGEIGREVAWLRGVWDDDPLSPAHPNGPGRRMCLWRGYVSLDELLERSDYISVHLPINASTRGLIDRAGFRRMKPRRHLVNVARPDIIDRNALIEALDEHGLVASDLTSATRSRPARTSRYSNTRMLSSRRTPRRERGRTA